MLPTPLRGLLELLLLSIGHQGFQLLMRIRHCRTHLLMAVLLAQRSVVVDRFHLLLLVLQDRQHLLLLIGGQVQHFRQMTQLTLRAWRMMMPHGLLAGLLVGGCLRGLCRSRAVILRNHCRR